MNWLRAVPFFISGFITALLLEIFIRKYPKLLDKLQGRRGRVAIVLLIFLAILAQIWSLVPDASPGHLRICAQTIGGLPAYPAMISLHSSDWKVYLGAKETNQTGCTDLWDNLAPGDYNFELYSPGYNGAYWGGGRTQVISGTLSTATIKRAMPYLKSVSSIPASIGQDQNLELLFEVANLAPNEWQVRVMIKLEKDATPSKYGPFFKQHVIPGNSAVPMTIEISNLEQGTYSLTYSVETLLPWSQQWKVTHDDDSHLVLNVE